MKKERSKYIRIATIAVISGAILYVVMSIIDNIGLVVGSVASAISFVLTVLRPVIIGFIIAFVLYRPSKFLSRLLGRAKFFAAKQRAASALGITIAYVFFLGFLAAFLALMIPGVIKSVGGITQDLPEHISAVDNWLKTISQNETVVQIGNFVGFDVANANSLGEIITEFWSEITAVLQDVTGHLFGFVVNTGLFVYNFVLGFFFSVYMLIFKDQIKSQMSQISHAVFKNFHYKLAFTGRVADDMFYRFIAGKGICSIAVGVITFVVCAIAGFKYAALISLIVMVTNMIPTIGPLIGAIPATLLAMLTAPIFGLYMVIIIIVLQVIDGNIIGPRVLGNSLGINAFWIIFSIIVMGALLGVVGMLIAAPLFGLLRILIKNWLYKRKDGYIKLDVQAEYEASLERYRLWSSKKLRKQQKT